MLAPNIHEKEDIPTMVHPSKEPSVTMVIQEWGERKKITSEKGVQKLSWLENIYEKRNRVTPLSDHSIFLNNRSFMSKFTVLRFVAHIQVQP